MNRYSFAPVIGKSVMQFIQHTHDGSEMLFEFDKKYEAKVRALVVYLGSVSKPKTITKIVTKKSTKLRNTKEYDKLVKFANATRRLVKSLDWKAVK